MSNFFKYNVLFISILSTTCLIAGENTSSSITDKIKNGLASTAGYLFSAGDASETNNQYAQNLAAKVGDTKIQVKKMNKLMEYLFGYKNTFVLPFVDQIYVNEEWINSLSTEQKRFVIGRTLVWLKNAPAYLTAQLGTEALTYFIDKKGKADFKRLSESDSAQGQKMTPEMIIQKGANLKSAFVLSFTNKLVRNLIKRHVQYNADGNTVKLFDCHRGGIETMNNISQYENDGTLLGKFFGTFPIMYVISHYIENPKIAMAIRAFTALPGRLHNSPDFLGNAVKNLPLVNYGSSFPQKESRIAALYKLAKNRK